MDASLNKQRVIDAVKAFNDGDLDGYLAIYARDAVVHGLPSEFGNSPAGHRRFLDEMRETLSEFSIEQKHLIAEGDLVSAHVTYSGVHDGMFHGVRPTGRKLEWSSMVVRRFNDDAFTVERWMVSDSLGLMRQLGVL